MYHSHRSFLETLLAVTVAAGIGACSKSKHEPEAVPAASGRQPATEAKPAAPGKTYLIAWSVWTGWMPFRLMQDKGFLAKRASEQGVSIELKEFKGYMDSVQAFAAQKVHGVTMTSMESLQPASNGVDSVAILVNDVSNGGDGVLVRGEAADVKSLKGKTVLLEEFSVSHYLLNRALGSAGMTEKDVKIKNIPGDDAGKAFLTDDKVQAVATWNPHLFKAVEARKGKVVFSSKDIPGEIIDFLVVNGDALKESPKLGTALVSAWYDAMQFITDQTTRTEAIEIMAKAAGASVQEFNKMLADTDLFYDKKRAGSFLESDGLKQTMAKVKQFSFDKGLVKDNSFAVGYSKDAKEKLRFDSSYVRAAQ
jgi:NitT/TauT family transport system substrate-binding protein